MRYKENVLFLIGAAEGILSDTVHCSGIIVVDNERTRY